MPLTLWSGQNESGPQRRWLSQKTGGSAKNYTSRMTKKDLATLAAVATIGGGIVALHGVTSKRWREGHTAFTALALIVALISYSQSQ